ncbi:Lon protease family protein [Pseudahrensia aquimaris]|uniref:endopeptidase La n=1 Tax=Pseudahrensia aquimaris TaxID=744461 RepID=A0ABW3F8M4_9HYPH
MIDNTELFLSDDAPPEGDIFPKNLITQKHNPKYNRYRVNVVVANDSDGDTKGSPLIFEDHPTLAKLIGRVEHLSQFGALVTDFTMIRAGALHRANGGYLVLDVRKILSEPFAWEALKRALRAKEIKIVSAVDEMGFTSTVSLEPEPIPLDVKVILIGERIVYYLLCDLDPEFGDLFKIEVDFDDQLQRTDDNVELYARLIATIAQAHKLRPLNADAVATVIEQTARLAEDSQKLSLRVGLITTLLQEANHWAGIDGRQTIAASNIQHTLDEQLRRSSRVQELSQEAIERGTRLITTDGSEIGQINALSVLTIGKFAFGQPSRITARVRSGAGKVIDIEREAKLGGPLHSKGVLILSGYLAAQFAKDVPLSLWASLVFEQSYGGVDGDSASCAELCALLSALSETPIKQSFAVTGSVNQLGVVQAIGGVNEKIEGFFDICAARGLTGEQGVLIPAANVKHLMLKQEVVDAAKAGSFGIYPMESVSDAIALLTGEDVGERDKDGAFPTNTINFRIEAKLRHFSDLQRKQQRGEEEQAS